MSVGSDILEVSLSGSWDKLISSAAAVARATVAAIYFSIKIWKKRWPSLP